MSLMINNQQFDTISGYLSALINTGIYLSTKTETLSGYYNNQLNSVSGYFTGQFNTGQYTSIDYTTGNIINLSNRLSQTGQSLQSQINSTNNFTGFLYPYNNPLNFANSGNIQSTGINILSYIANLSGYYNSNPSGYIIASQTGQFYPTSNPQNYSNSGNIQNTGQFLWNFISSISGNLIVTGQTLYNLINNFSGVFNNTGNSLQNSINMVSGNLVTTGSNLYNLINNFSGVSNNTGIQLQLQINRHPLIIPLIASPIIWSNMPLALNFFNASAGYRTLVDLSGFSQVNLISNIATAGTVSGYIQLRYFNNDSTTVTQYIPIDTGNSIINLGQARIATSGWQNLVPGAKSGIYIGLIGISGSAAVSPVFGLTYAQFR